MTNEMTANVISIILLITLVVSLWIQSLIKDNKIKLILKKVYTTLFYATLLLSGVFIYLYLVWDMGYHIILGIASLFIISYSITKFVERKYTKDFIDIGEYIGWK